MSIVTRTGDRGQTSLFGGERVSKASLRIEACGLVDALNAEIGVVLAHSCVDEVRMLLTPVQHMLFSLGAELATPLTKGRVPREQVQAAHLQFLEDWITRIEPLLPAQTSFILPGGTEAAALLHVARSTCRTAERRVVAVQEQASINPLCVMFLNRLSDAMFLAARFENFREGRGDIAVKYGSESWLQ